MTIPIVIAASRLLLLQTAISSCKMQSPLWAKIHFF